jgi:DNA replication licensing factor MCM2
MLTFILVHGVVTSRSDVYNQLMKVFYKCYRCGVYKGPYFINKKTQPNFGRCNSCQSNGPFVLDRIKSIYRNYQTINVQ